MTSEDNKLTQEEMDIIMSEARAGELESLKEIFEEIPKESLLDIKDNMTLATPIHMAAANGHLDTVKYLLSIIPKQEAISLTKAKNETGNTALHWAAYNGHLEAVKLLVEEYEADAFEKNEAGHDSIYEAENNGKVDVENWFLKKYAPEEDFKVEEDGENTRISYQPGKESKLADDNAREAAFAAKVESKQVGKAEKGDQSLENSTASLSLDS
ncbi:YAR1 [Candida margitis]|uniref:YAR1 n=1 Tax=Candida margitis TaxID=1775924 RepID=UPI002227EB9D|nr:YAR1 [Candida margitis]KAI5970197.1 YAR1 [Candida margitis]